MQPTRQNKVTHLSIVIGLLLVFGLYFPTTASQHLSIFSVSGYLICFVLLATLALRKRGHSSFPVCIVLLSITPLLLVFTFTSQLSTLRLGALLGYGVLSLLLISNLRDIGLPQWFEHMWVAVNIVNIFAGFAIVVGIQPINDFIIARYSVAYDELLPNMLALHKPVLTFGSHSTAAFFLYLFFWINLQRYKLGGQKLSLMFSECYHRVPAVGVSFGLRCCRDISAGNTCPVVAASQICFGCCLSVPHFSYGCFLEQLDQLGRVP